MMKKIVLAALASATALGASGSAYAASTTAAGGVQFTVGTACTLTASVVDVGTYNVGDTVSTYAARQGKWVAATVTAGTDSAKTLASVNCPSGTAWRLYMVGSGPNGGTPVKDPSSTTVFNTYAYVNKVGGTAITPTAVTTSSVLNGTGTGQAQNVDGFYVVADPSNTQLSSSFSAGTYTGSNTATIYW
ncbi:hypothetical protein [Sphingomonas sp.]|uniref:hypothetical protein n=1 Tax=Sphingomonas sp. TaxID=28214 RepID=UPI0035C7C98C